jgi:uncharacterized protein (TIGR02246 family)
VEVVVHLENIMSTETAIVTSVLEQWKSAVDAHDAQRVAEYFTEDAIFQGLHPYSVGRDGVATYYDSQPIGMVANYTVVQTRRLAEDLVLGYLDVNFTFADRPTVHVYLSVVLHRIDGVWLIAHYQVSRLAG